MTLKKAWIIWISFILLCVPVSVFASDETPYTVSVASYRNGTKCAIMKYHKFTGTAWLLGKNGFQEISESQAIPRSTYHIEITPLMQGWNATRIDTKTGQTWRVSEGQWITFD